MIRALVAALLALSIPSSHQDGRVPPPGADQIKAAEKLIKDVFKAELARPGSFEQIALARRFLQEGRDTKEDVAAKFVLLRESQELAAQAGDVQTALAAADEMSRFFAVDGSALKLGALNGALKAARQPEEFKAIGEAFLAFAEEALQSGDADASQKSAETAVQVARRAKELPLLKRAEAAVKAVAEAKASQARVRKAMEKLETAPDDPEANLAAGKHYCFKLRNWEKGLGFLAKSSDAALKSLAAAEMAGPSGDDVIKLADGWWDAAEKDGTIRAVGRVHALDWYAKGWPEAKGLTREKARARLRTAAGVPTASKPGGRAAGWTFSMGSSLETEFSKSGKQSVRVPAPTGAAQFTAVDSSRFKATPDQKYVLSAWVFSDGNSGPRDDLFIRFWAPGGGFVGQTGPLIPIDQPFWTRISSEVPIPAGVAEIDVSLQMRSRAGVLWIDDVSLKLEGRELLVNGSFEQ